MKASIHSTAVVSPECELGEDVSIGPFAIVEASHIESGCKIESHAHVYANTHIGKNSHIWQGAIVGSDPQDRKYKGETSYLHLGEGVVVREYATLNRGTCGGTTQLGNGVLVMAYAHVAHDCVVGDGAVLANGVQLGGHVQVDANSVIGGLTAIHQFCRVGECCFVGGTLKIDRNVPPFSKAFGNPLRWAGINRVGMLRAGYSEEDIGNLKSLYRMFYSSGRTINDLKKHESNFHRQANQFKAGKSLNQFLQDHEQNILLSKITYH